LLKPQTRRLVGKTAALATTVLVFLFVETSSDPLLALFHNLLLLDFLVEKIADLSNEFFIAGLSRETECELYKGIDGKMR